MLVLCNSAPTNNSRPTAVFLEVGLLPFPPLSFFIHIRLFFRWNKRERTPRMIRRHPTPSEGATTQTTTAGVTGLRHRIAEASGKVAADCAALCCCCPCSVMNLVALAVYRVPAGLCRRVAGKRRRGVTARKRRGVSGGGAGNGQARPSEGEVDGEDSVVELLRKAREEGGGGGAGVDAAEQSLEQEMWERFSRTGFWRSPSTKDS